MPFSAGQARPSALSASGKQRGANPFGHVLRVPQAIPTRKPLSSCAFRNTPCVCSWYLRVSDQDLRGLLPIPGISRTWPGFGDCGNGAFVVAMASAIQAGAQGSSRGRDGVDDIREGLPGRCAARPGWQRLKARPAIDAPNRQVGDQPVLVSRLRSVLMAGLAAPRGALTGHWHHFMLAR